jgi:hypothetical protein
MKKSTLIGLLALAGFGYLSWNGPAAKDKSLKEHQATVLANVFGHAPAGISGHVSAGKFGHAASGGQSVPMAYILPCLDSFAAVMSRYGITSNNPPVPITTMPASTYLITTSENLGGQNFVNWIDSVVTAYDPVGKGANITLKIKPGICTHNFAANVPNAASRAGRISFFIIPVVVNSSGQASPAGGGGGSGYEVGDIEP